MLLVHFAVMLTFLTALWLSAFLFSHTHAYTKCLALFVFIIVLKLCFFSLFFFFVLISFHCSFLPSFVRNLCTQIFFYFYFRYYSKCFHVSFAFSISSFNIFRRLFVIWLRAESKKKIELFTCNSINQKNA